MFHAIVSRTDKLLKKGLKVEFRVQLTKDELFKLKRGLYAVRQYQIANDQVTIVIDAELDTDEEVDDETKS
jgi:hypothetical protein